MPKASFVRLSCEHLMTKSNICDLKPQSKGKNRKCLVYDCPAKLFFAVPKSKPTFCKCGKKILKKYLVCAE